MSFPVYVLLITGIVGAGYMMARVTAERALSGAFNGGHFQKAFQLLDGIMVGVDRSGAVKILHDGRLYHHRASDFRVSECRTTGLWKLINALFNSGFSRYEIQLRSKERSAPEKLSRFMVSFCSQVTKENFLSCFAPAALESGGPQKEGPEHRREVAALLQIARRCGHRRTRQPRIKGFKRTVGDLACLFDPAAAGFSWMTGRKREVSAVRKIYVRAIGKIYGGYGDETIDTYLRAHFEEVWKSGRPGN